MHPMIGCGWITLTDGPWITRPPGKRMSCKHPIPDQNYLFERATTQILAVLKIAKNARSAAVFSTSHWILLRQVNNSTSQNTLMARPTIREWSQKKPANSMECRRTSLSSPKISVWLSWNIRARYFAFHTALMITSRSIKRWTQFLIEWFQR